MLSISPGTLRRLYLLSQIPNPPASLDGPISLQGMHRLEHKGGGVFLYQTGDKRIQMVSQLDVSGKDSAWVRRVNPKSLKSLKEFDQAGGSYVISTASESCLSLQKNFTSPTSGEPLFRYPLFCPAAGRNSTPLIQSPPVDIILPLDLDSLKRALRIMAHHNPQNLTNTVSFLEDRRCHCYRSRIHMQISPIAIPFPIHLYSRDAEKVLQWLNIILLVTGQIKEGAVERQNNLSGIGLHELLGNRFYWFRSPCGRHYLRVEASTKPCQPGHLDRMPPGDNLILSCTMERKDLQELAKCMQCHQNHKLHFRIDSGGKNHFRVDLIGTEWSEPLGVLPFTLEGDNLAEPDKGFIISPHDLNNLIKAHNDKEIRIKVFGKSNTMALQSRVVGPDIAPMELQTVCRFRHLPPQEENQKPVGSELPCPPKTVPPDGLSFTLSE
jgi:hypothetical protein